MTSYVGFSRTLRICLARGSSSTIRIFFTDISYDDAALRRRHFIALAGLGTIIARSPFAKMQGLMAGGTMPAGCVVAEGIALLLLAAVLLVMRANGLLD